MVGGKKKSGNSENSLQLSDVLPKKHLNLILVDTERWRRGVHLLHRAEASRALL